MEVGILASASLTLTPITYSILLRSTGTIKDSETD